MTRSAVRPLSLLAPLALAGCLASPVTPDQLPVACGAFRPITYDDAPGADTFETVRQILEHNAVGVELCAWAVPVP